MKQRDADRAMKREIVDRMKGTIDMERRLIKTKMNELNAKWYGIMREAKTKELKKETAVTP